MPINYNYTCVKSVIQKLFNSIKYLHFFKVCRAIVI